MSKANRETLLPRGEQLLREWDVGADATPQQLSVVSGRDVAADLAIAARLGALFETPGQTDALLALERSSHDKLVLKEIKRSLYRLSQHGVKPPPAPETTSSRPLVPALEGYVSALDGRGDQLVWLVKPRPGVVDQLIAVISDPQGLRDVALAETTRKSLRAAADEMRTKHDIRMVEADWRYCDFIIARAYAWATEAKQPITGDYKGMRARLLAEAPPVTMPPLAYTVYSADEVRADTSALQHSGELLEEPELRTWFFTPEDLKPYLDELQAVKDSPLVLSELQQRERFGEVIAKAVETIFGGSMQASWVRRLQEMAYFFHQTRRVERGRQSLAAALALEASSHGGREIPFCEMLARTCFTAYWKMSEEKQAEQAESSLIVSPAQAARQAQRRPR